MKNIKILLLSFAVIFCGISIYSCGNKHKHEHSHEKQGKEYTSAYICPMHCDGSGSDAAGDCPVCGMPYEVNEDHKADNHKHEDGHDHDHEHKDGDKDNKEGDGHDHDHDHNGHGHDHDH